MPIDIILLIVIMFLIIKTIDILNYNTKIDDINKLLYVLREVFELPTKNGG